MIGHFLLCLSHRNPGRSQSILSSSTMDIRSDPSKHGGKSMRQSTSVADSDSVLLATSLPEEIISNILIKLPVKSLIRFKSVCRSWRELISDPIFVKAHLQGNIQDKNYAHHGLIMENYNVRSCSLSSVLNEESSITTLDYSLKDQKQQIWIVNSVNGLVCIHSKSHIYIWNPSTRRVKRLPHYGIEIDPGDIISYGFGYEEANSDYKVVVIYRSECCFERPCKVEGKIYGLKTDSWRKIDDFYIGKQLYEYAFCTFVSGSLNWAVYGGIIASFDLSKETCSVTKLPFYLKKGMICCSKLGNLSGSLCQLSYVYRTMTIDLWAMKEFGKVESWSKMYSIPYQCEKGFLQSIFQHNASLIISGKNKVLMLIGSALMLYNLETKTFTQPKIQNLRFLHDVETYIESLVSPHLMIPTTNH
ncbi:F-box/kelch-repeat protein At3g23880-like [Impatiens glandulifera]|uniref:F-box/kelch-repeat protein At3g23880-like n=1 Tax=Impatiens glandulifera TaxID=253017 RepID=UPI001FB178A5|nr:F-box/kelch-repeat protein At3g23880-like [Impatiens glandulifera]